MITMIYMIYIHIYSKLGEMHARLTKAISPGLMERTV